MIQPTLPPLSQTPSPNYSSRNGQSIRLIVVHDTESDSAPGTVSWFAQTASQVSAHLVMWPDGSKVVQMVPFAEKAWAVCNFNGVSISVEGAGVEKEGYSDAWWQTMANIVAWLLHAYGLPPKWAQGGGGSGFCSHYDLGQAGGGHSDPTTDAASWAKFVGLVYAAYAAWSSAPLPVWGLHGLAAPLALSAPASPPVGWTPSAHEAAPRAVIGDIAGPWPVGSLGWAQSKLGVTVDGLNGPQTQGALRTFQGSHPPLAVDGEIGPATIVALLSAPIAAGGKLIADLNSAAFADLSAPS